MTGNSAGVAYVSFIEGEVKARDAKGQVRILQLNDLIYEGDVVTTGHLSTVVISLSDNTTLRLGEQQSLAVDEQVITSSPDLSAGLVSTLEASEAETVIKIFAANDPKIVDRGLASEDPGSGPNFVNLLRIIEMVPVASYEFPSNPTGTPPVIEGEAGFQLTGLSVEGVDASVYEAGLVEGSGGGRLSTADGTFRFHGDFETLTITSGGSRTTLDIGDLTTGTTFVGDHGVMTIISYDALAGLVAFTYRLSNSIASRPAEDDGQNIEAHDIFSLTISSSSASTSSKIDITIIDDVPTAVSDADSVMEDAPLPATGNVITDTSGGDAGDSDTGADTLGADRIGNGEYVTGVARGVASEALRGGVGSSISGSYGTIVLDGDGSYTYTLDNTNLLVQQLAPGETLTETYSYTLTDEDGDTSTASLVITITGTDDLPLAVADTATIEEDEVSVTGEVRENDTLGDGTAAQNVTTLNGSATGSYGTIVLMATAATPTRWTTATRWCSNCNWARR